MSRLGKCLKNRFLAMALAGAMVITSVASSGMPVFAEESSSVEVAADVETQRETKDVSEEAAEEEEVKQKDTEETETQENDRETTESKSETTAKKETATASKTEDDKEIREDEESGSDSEAVEESQTDADNKSVIYTADSAELVDGHTYATWGLSETALIDDGTPMTADAFQGKNGIYKNAAGDMLYIDTKYSGESGKFAPATGQARVNKTKIYIPVKIENNQAKIILYQSSISVQDQVIYQDGMTDNSFALSGTDFESAQCSAFVKSGDTYRTELTCTLTGNKESSIICIEIKGAKDNYISQIISGEEVRDDVYDNDYGNSKDLVKFNMEGYANAYGVTGGGMMKNTPDTNYYEVKDAFEFLDALLEIKNANEPAVIEVTGDLDLGSEEIGVSKEANGNNANLSKYKDIIGANKFQALWHPTLITSGVSDLTLEGFNDLTIFSSNEKGAAIKHCNIIVKKSTNIIFRNFTFDELWEWDDGGTVEAEKTTYVRGGYKRNDWDYLCIDSESDGIWIDHCTFYKAYDGLIDIKNPKTGGEERVTISWCKFEPKSAPDENGDHPFYDAQLEVLEEDYKKGENAEAIYYRSLRTTESFTHTYRKYTNNVGAETTETFKGEGYSLEDIITYTCGHKKAHLLGQGDEVENAVGIRVTFANNSWVNCMERLPRLRRGISHEYNCILDSSELYAAKKAGSKAKSHLVSNGATSTMDGSIFLENCYIDGIDRPLLSGNSNSPRGYIGFEGCEYIHDDDELTVITNGPDADEGLGEYAMTKAQFKEKLPSNYGTYQLYAATDLKTKVLPYAGAGSVKMSAVQWMKTSYGEGGSGEDSDIDSSTEEPETGGSSTPESETDKGSSEAENSSETQESSSEETTGSEVSSSEESSSEENSSVEASSEYGETFSLRADEIKVDGVETAEFELESDHIQNGFTIKASGTSKVAVGSSSATVAGVKYNKRLRLSGDADKDKYSVHFTAKDAGTLWVYAKNASSSGNKILALNKLEGNSAIIKQRELLDKEVAAVRYDITEPGDYYIAPEVKGIDVYYISFTTKKEIEPEYTKPSRPTGDIVYDAKEGADNTKTAYNMEGYAASANVTGGGLIKEEDTQHYYKVTNEKELLDALKATRSQTETPNVIEITTDLNLGDLEMNTKYPEVNIQKRSDGDNTPYSGYIRAQMSEPIMHPVLKETGASYIKLHDFHNLTIFSKNGASIKHCGITIEGGTSNVIIRNLVFDELWEWDEETSGDYDRNDWDYMTIEDNATDIWVDHCTFYRSYDGILDMKNDSKYKGLQRVTVSWCEVLPGSKDPEFFDTQMNWLEENIDQTIYYKKLRQTEGMTKEDIWWSAYGQKKAHLLGSGNGDIQDQAIRATFANNYYKNAQARLPRLRFGKTHVYNTVIDSAEMNAQHEKMKAAGKESHITGDGAISACYGEMLLENCYIDGARTPLRSGRGSTAGYINTDNCLYYMNGASKELTISEYAPGTRKETDITAFREKLPYTYNKYDPAALKERLQESAGAGKLEMTAVQWMRTNYNTDEGGGDEGSGSTEGSSNPESSAIEGSSNPESSSTEESGSAAGVHIVITKPAENAVFDYTGAKITPDVEVRDYDRDKINGEILVQGVDYTVKYSNNAKVGSEAMITIIGKGNYKGKAVTTKFQIKNADRLAEGATPVEVKGAKIAIENQEYTGKAQYPNFTLTLKGGSPVEYTYNEDKGIYETVTEPKTPIPAYVAVSNNVNKGTATLLLTGASDAKGKTTTVKKTFKITSVDLSKANADDIVITSPADAEYAVKGAVPETLSITYKGMPLKLGKDYTVKYGNNKKAGQSGTITITGKGNYAKKYGQQKTYDIKKLDLSQGDRLKAVTAYEKIKKKAVKATVVDRNGTVIKPSEYDITIYKNVKTEGEKKIGVDAYEENEELQTGTIYVQVTAKTGDKINLQNSTEPIEFAVGVNIAKAKVTDKKTGKTAITQDYKGVPIELQESDLVVTMKGEADPLKPDTDYEIVSHENNVNKGTATAVIKGKGKYSGTKTVKFKIVQREMVKGEKIAQDTINALKNYMNRFSNGIR